MLQALLSLLRRFAQITTSTITSISVSPTAGGFCGECYVVAEIQTLIAGLINSTATTFSVGNAHFSFNPTSLFSESGIAARCIYNPSGCRIVPICFTLSHRGVQADLLFRTSPSRVFFINDYATTRSTLLAGTCLISAGFPIETQFTAFGQNLSGDDDVASVETAFSNVLPLSCPSVASAALTISTAIVSSPALSPASSPQATVIPTSSVGRSSTSSQSFLPPTSSATLPVTASSSSAAPITTSSSPNPPSPATSGLSAAAKVGVGVGVSLGTIIIALLVILLWRLERRQKPKTGVSALRTSNSYRKWIPFLHQKAELDAEEQRRNEMEGVGVRREMDGGKRYELPAGERRHELKSENGARELEVS